MGSLFEPDTPTPDTITYAAVQYPLPTDIARKLAALARDNIAARKEIPEPDGKPETFERMVDLERRIARNTREMERIENQLRAAGPMVTRRVDNVPG